MHQCCLKDSSANYRITFSWEILGLNHSHLHLLLVNEVAHTDLQLATAGDGAAVEVLLLLRELPQVPLQEVLSRSLQQVQLLNDELEDNDVNELAKASVKIYI